MTALQPLTDIQVQNRLDAYNPGGALERDIRALWDAAGDIIEAEVSEQFGDAAAAKTRGHYTTRVDAAWVQGVAEYGRRLFAEKSSVPAYIAARDQLIGRITARMFERLAAEPDRLLECTLSFQRLTAYETDIILAQVALLEADQAADQRSQQTKVFERNVTDLVGKGVSQDRGFDQAHQLHRRRRPRHAWQDERRWPRPPNSLPLPCAKPPRLPPV
jgi:methyl-accepting chemotaxis protein